jgi:hypothetical protein
MKLMASLLVAGVLGCSVMPRPAHAGVAVFVGVAPPAPLVQVVPVAPRVGYVWTPGYWSWNGFRYVWIGGAYVVPPRPAAVWVPGRWYGGPRGWAWAGGHWR